MTGPTRSEWRPYRPDTLPEAIAIVLISIGLRVVRAAVAVKGWRR